MLFDIEHNVQIARRSTVGPGFAFAGNAKPRSGIHTRRNTQLNGFLAFEASLPAAFRATLLHDLPRSLTRWARARDGEKSLLIGKLAAASASLAGLNVRDISYRKSEPRCARLRPRRPLPPPNKSSKPKKSPKISWKSWKTVLSNP